MIFFGEDSLSTFSKQQTIEMYVEDADGGYQGEKELIQQFGLENRNEITFVVSRTRFDDVAHQMDLETATASTQGSILLESGTITSSLTNKISASFGTAYLRGEAASTSLYANRPKEGDLIFHPVLNKIFEVAFVDEDEPFHQLDNNPVYKLRCKSFEYSSEVLDTGITEIDAVEDGLSTDTMNFQFTLEAETGSIVLESDIGETNYLINEDFTMATQQPVDQGKAFETAAGTNTSSTSDDILDFSERNPFGEVDDY